MLIRRSGMRSISKVGQASRGELQAHCKLTGMLARAVSQAFTPGVYVYARVVTN